MFCFIFFHVFSQSQKWQIQVGFEIHDWLRYSSSILKSLAIWGLKKKIIIPILPKNSVLGDNKRFGLVVTNSKNSVNTFFFFCSLLFASYFTSSKNHKKRNSHSEIRYENSLKNSHIFFVMHTFAKAIIIFLCVLNLAEWIEKKLRFFRAGITALVAKAFWQWISKIHYFKGFVDDNRGGKDKAKNQGRDNFFFM